MQEIICCKCDICMTVIKKDVIVRQRVQGTNKVDQLYRATLWECSHCSDRIISSESKRVYADSSVMDIDKIIEGSRILNSELLVYYI